MNSSSASALSLEDLCLTIANGDRALLAELRNRLAQEKPRLFPLWPADRREAWSNGLELVLESFNRTHPAAEEVAFLEALMLTAYDSAPFRDLLAAAARQRFSAYADPAGLIKAFGIHAPAATMPHVSRRWQTMCGLLTEKTCFHPTHGVGTIQDVDGLANAVLVTFAQKRTVPLEQALDAFILIRQDSFLGKLLRKEAALPHDIGLDQLRQQTAASILPAVPCSDDLLRQLFVPALLHEGEFQAVLSGIRAAPASGISKVVAPGKERQWFQARNLEELADLLQKTESVELGADHLAVLRELFTRFGMKKEQAIFMAEAAGRLWTLSGGDATLRDLFRDAVAMVKPWQDRELFVEITDDLAGKCVPAWFEATHAACGLEWLCETAAGLPLRLFSALGKILAKIEDGPEEFLDAVLALIQKQKPSADVLLWLWKSKRSERDGMADPGLIFKTLSKPVRGNYIKANKELRKLLLEDEEFQRFVMLDGDHDAIASMVSCARHVPLLDAGEKQSLLVKIVRLFPAAISLVEQRSDGKSVRAMDKITSIRSFELLRRELDDIIGVQIPANSRAIGVARSYGDLRENAEFKAAKEHQRLLRLRRNELERTIHEVKSFDFAAVVPAGKVVPGCVVTIALPGGETETHTVLGLRDGNPERFFLSYESPLGKALVGKAVGETVEMPSGGTATVRDISPIPQELHKWLRGEDLL